MTVYESQGIWSQLKDCCLWKSLWNKAFHAKLDRHLLYCQGQNIHLKTSIFTLWLQHGIHFFPYTTKRSLYIWNFYLFFRNHLTRDCKKPVDFCDNAFLLDVMIVCTYCTYHVVFDMFQKKVLYYRILKSDSWKDWLTFIVATLFVLWKCLPS